MAPVSRRVRVWGHDVWEAHGLALPPRIPLSSFAFLQGTVSVQALRTDEFFGSATLPGSAYPYDAYEADDNPGLFQLAPDVRLVPLKTVVLYVPGDRDWGQGWLPKPLLQALFDDYWTGTKQIFSPGVSGLFGAEGEWSSGCPGCPGPFPQPDRVWDQCGVQFRVVKYHECPVSKAVFDYNVVALGLNPPQNFVCNLETMHDVVQDALATCPGFDFADELTPVIFKGDLAYEHQLCSGVKVRGYTSDDGSSVYIRHQGHGLLIAHELGHIFGLDDNTFGANNNCSEPHTLMCSTDPQHDLCSPAGIYPDNPCSICGPVRVSAKNKQDAYWGP